ncbi:MAG: glycosyltransferase family 2 protein [Roseburia sp.]|nr:glycosyltransferase family 2 protein [Roseburia sp.]
MYGKVSIVMPNYNCERFIRETINSVLSQTYTNWELLIVDDRSTDRSVEIIREFCERDERIKLFIKEENSGAAASRNLALREATGRWIAFLDSDDLWLPEKLGKQLAFMNDNGYSFTFTKYRQIDENSERLNSVVVAPEKITQRQMKYCCCYLGCLTVMYDADKVGLIQIDESIKKRNDDAMWLKVRKYADAYYLDELLAEYRVRKGSISHQGKLSLVKYHYRLYRVGEKKNPVSAFFCMAKNILKVFKKKRKYILKEVVE